MVDVLLRFEIMRVLNSVEMSSASNALPASLTGEIGPCSRRDSHTFEGSMLSSYSSSRDIVLLPLLKTDGRVGMGSSGAS